MPPADADPNRPAADLLSGPEPAGTAPGGGGVRVAGRAWMPALAALAGLIAGAGAWAIGETSAVVVRPAEAQVPFMGMGPLVPSVTPEASLAAQRRTAARAFGVLGALTGLLLGLLAGASTAPRSRRLSALAGGFGLVAGGLAGAGAAWLAPTAFAGWRAASPDDLMASLLLHAACGLPIGAVGGLALGFGDRDRALRGLAGGLAGALAATVLYEILGASVFPMDATGDLISKTPASRLLARLLLPALAAAGAALALRSGRRPADSATP